MAFNDALTETITMYVKSAGSYVNGRFVEGTETPQSITASIQRLDMRERQLLPEGVRGKETLKLYTEVSNVPVVENDVTPIEEAAEFEIRGKRYAMLASEVWKYLVPHWKVTVVCTDG